MVVKENLKFHQDSKTFLSNALTVEEENEKYKLILLLNEWFRYIVVILDLVPINRGRKVVGDKI